MKVFTNDTLSKATTKIKTLIMIKYISDYDEQLTKRSKIENRRIVAPATGHRWIDDSPDLIAEWISRFN